MDDPAPPNPRRIKPVDAAGLVLIRAGKRGEPEILLGRRHTRAGFLPDIYVAPGGRVDPTDTTLLHTALREAHEEVGIEPAVVDVLGGFPTMSTVSSGMLVAPFVGVLKRPVEYRIQEVEVAQVFEVSLRELADPRYRGIYEWRRDKDRAASNFPAIFHSGQTIWGLTLRITENLLDMMEIPRPS